MPKQSEKENNRYRRRRESVGLVYRRIRPLGGILALVIFISVSFSCSHYSTRGRLPSHIQSVYIPTFENQTAEFFLPQQITDALTDRFLSEANLRLGDYSSADAELHGTVRRYYEEAETYRQDTNVEVTGRRVTIALDVEFLDRTTNETLWQDRNFSRWVVYEPDSETEEEAAGRVVELLADDLISSVLQQW